MSCRSSMALPSLSADACQGVRADLVYGRYLQQGENGAVGRRHLAGQFVHPQAFDQHGKGVGLVVDELAHLVDVGLGDQASGQPGLDLRVAAEPGELVELHRAGAAHRVGAYHQHVQHADTRGDQELVECRQDAVVESCRREGQDDEFQRTQCHEPQHAPAFQAAASPVADEPGTAPGGGLRGMNRAASRPSKESPASSPSATANGVPRCWPSAATRTDPATATPSDEPRLETARDRPEMSAWSSSPNDDCTTLTEAVSMTPMPKPISSRPGTKVHTDESSRTSSGTRIMPIVVSTKPPRTSMACARRLAIRPATAEASSTPIVAGLSSRPVWIAS